MRVRWPGFPDGAFFVTFRTESLKRFRAAAGEFSADTEPPGWPA
jgi:hypothetical protein